MEDIRSLWNFSDPAASEATFRARITEADGTWSFELQTQLARSLGMQRKFEEALAVLDGLPPVEGDPTERWQAYALLEQGRVFNSSGLKDKARPCFDRAATTPHDDLRIDAIHMQAIVGEPAEALDLNERAIQEAKTSEDPRARRWLGSLLNNLAWTYHDLGNHERALQLFQDALDYRLEQGDPETIKIARWCVGRCLRSLGRFEEALAVQRGLDSADGFVAEELGECLLALGNEEDARVHFARAYERLSQDAWLAENEPARLERLRGLGALSK